MVPDKDEILHVLISTSRLFELKFVFKVLVSCESKDYVFWYDPFQNETQN